MWKAKIRRITRTKAYVDFTDGSEEFTREYDLGSFTGRDALLGRIDNELEGLTKSHLLASELNQDLDKEIKLDETKLESEEVK